MLSTTSRRTIALLARRSSWRTTTSAFSTDRSVTIQDIRVESPPIGSNRADLVPPLDYRFLASLPPTYETILRWMLQKDLVLRQDFCLLSHSAADRRALAYGYAALVSREIEYVSISRDTTDSDLKQRKAIENGVSLYIDQGPVRAARNGRLLILDGIEKAERNVLPTLNNLLENRSLSLDDGTLLVDSATFERHNQRVSDVTLHKVHDDFRVLALLSADQASSLDPPLRSRFQGLLMPNLNAGELLYSVVKHVDASKLSLKKLKAIVQSSSKDSVSVCLSTLARSASYVEKVPSVSTAAVKRGFNGEGLTAADISMSEESVETTDISTTGFVETESYRRVAQLISNGLSTSRGVAIVGPKGCGKSAAVKHFARHSGKVHRLFPLVSDYTSRDLFLNRGTNEDGDTIWRPTPLTKAVENGDLVVLDGIDKLNTDTLTSLGQLLQFGEVDLPDGRRIVAHDGFQCIALGHPPSSSSWISSEVASLFHWIEMGHLPSDDLYKVLSSMFTLDNADVKKLVACHDILDQALRSGATDSVKEEESFTLSLRKLKHICKRLKRKAHEISELVGDALMTDLMPARTRKIVFDSMRKSGIPVNMKASPSTSIESLDIELIDRCKRTPENPLLVPNTVFQENAAHKLALNSILEAHAVGENALLVMGYQGVGKNKVVDYLLQQLNCEREYVQLHRDTTVQSMLSSPTVEDGRIIYNDSPLVRAALNGRILVIDEADKAPVEVVAMLKGLIEDGELALPDGRNLRYENGSEESTVLVHPEFRVWALANPTGYPFHGNDLAREMSDVFSCITIAPLDSASQTTVLKSYGPNVPQETVSKIVAIWEDLRQAHSSGIISYPFSVREAVSVVRHLNQFPEDGISQAVENVVAFNRSDKAVINLLGSVLSKHGVEVVTLAEMSSALDASGNISTPRTRAGSPKHGKVDPDNTPHVGGNTWYGGTGGSDTAGLGGRGGPYRVDLGHPVHQVSDEMKAQVTKEAEAKARQIAKAELKKKLKELDMGEYDWDRYNELRDRVALQIEQLRTQLKDVRIREEQRVWLKRQTNGEIDDNRWVETLAGEKDVFKRRGVSSQSHSSSHETRSPLKIKLVVDVSASMFRFNGADGRLERLLESTLMIMEALRDDERFELEIYGHNGSNSEIPLKEFSTVCDEPTQLRILLGMIAHTQYTYAGDQTLEAIEAAMNKASTDELVLVVSDANLQRYYISPNDVASLLNKSGVHAHLILISSFGKEAFKIASKVPNGRATVCLDSSELPLILKQIVSSAADN